jgi:hypothetical protein
MKRKYIAGLAIGLMMIGIAGASHATTFDFTYSQGTTILGNGEISATDIGGGIFTVTSGFVNDNQYGTFNFYPASTISGYLTSPSNSFYYNNIFYSSGQPYLDTYGLLFTNSSNEEFNIWGNGINQQYSEWISLGTQNYFVQNSVNFTANAVPEPATMLLFGAGLIGLCGLTRRNKKA